MVADVAEAAHGSATTNHTVQGELPAATAAQITAIVDSYTSGSGHRIPDTAKELDAILPGVTIAGAREYVAETDDVFFIGRDSTENHIEIKTPKPNYDQARASKRRILRIYAVRHPVKVRAFVGMVYNPNGLYGEYEWPTTKYFLDEEADLMVGREFWNYVGASDATYGELLDCFLEVATRRRQDLLDLLAEV
jgi:hypothetical protein